MSKRDFEKAAERDDAAAARTQKNLAKIEHGESRRCIFCPRSSSVTVNRSARFGDFWDCRMFPRCTGSVPV